MIEDDTDSDDDQQEQDQKITRVGYIEMKKISKSKKVTWKAVHCVLVGGSFYWYKDAKELIPLGACDLQTADIDGHVTVGSKDCFGLVNGGDYVFTGYLSSETNRESWVLLLQEGKGKNPVPPPSRDEGKKLKKMLLIELLIKSDRKLLLLLLVKRL